MKIDLNPTKHLSSLPRRKKWKFIKKPRRIKTKNYLYSLSSVNVFFSNIQQEFGSQFKHSVVVDSLEFSCRDRMFMAKKMTLKSVL